MTIQVASRCHEGDIFFYYFEAPQNNFKMFLMYRQIRLSFLIFFAISLSISVASAAPLRSEVAQAIASGQSIDVIVEYDDSAIEEVAKKMRKKTRNHFDDQKTINYKIKEYSLLRGRIDGSLGYRNDINDIANYKHMPLSHKRINSISAMDALLAQPGIKGIYPNAKLKRALTQSLPLINQPTVAYAGEQGQGTTVAVIDDGIWLNNPDFGACTAPNTPSQSCKIVESVNIIDNPGYDYSHGTNVAAIVLGVAPGTKIAALNIFDQNGSGLESDVIAAIDWAIENKSKYNIVAINMSLVDDTHNTSPCDNDWSSAAISRANASGISVVASAGNSGYTDGLPSPACSPGVISVGAVYDGNVGPRGYLSPRCKDSITHNDKIICFSNSANFLTLLAPGAIITAADISLSGTSQAAPHVAGAVAVLRSTYPNESLAEIQARLTNTGVPITDPRNNITTPRLNLLAAATPTNDLFHNRAILNGLSGSVSGTTLLASKEVDEPMVAGIVGGQSVWWKWTAPQSGQLSLNTNGSGFDSLLAVYSGSELNALNPIAFKDNTGSLSSSQTNLVMQVTAGTEYELSLDVANGAASSFVLNWSLNTNPHANLSTSITGSTTAEIGSNTTYTLTVTNSGPQSATNVVATLNVPAGAAITPTSTSCSVSNSIMSCTAGTLPNGGSQSFDFQITWNEATSTNIITASIVSDLSSANTPLNSSTMNVGTISRNAITETQNFDNADIPSLPEWAMIMLGLSLLLINLRATKS